MQVFHWWLLNTAIWLPVLLLKAAAFIFQLRSGFKTIKKMTVLKSEAFGFIEVIFKIFKQV
jgi:hypothetical protein